MVGVRRAALGLVALLGCHAEKPLSLPNADPPAAGAIIAVDDGRGTVLVRGFEPGTPPPRLTLGDGVTVLVAYFEQPLSTYGLAAGDVELAEAGDTGRPFPVPSSIFVGKSADKRPPDFETVGADHEAFVALRRPSATIESCFEGGGCYTAPEAIASRVCTTPCPTPSLEPPASPTEPTPPDFGDCPTGWSARTEGAIDWCEPPPRDDTCGAFEAQWAGAASCVRLGPACSGTWSTDLTPNKPVVYVQPLAMGGDGSTQRPYGTIAEAIAQSSGDRVIALHAGRYAEAVLLEDGVELVGDCVEQTIIEAASGNAFRLESGTATVRALHVERAGAESVEVFASGDLTLRDVRLTGQTNRAIVRAIGTVTLELERVLVRGRGEAGLVVASGATATLTDAHFEMEGLDVWATGAGTTLTVTNAAFSEDSGTNPLPGIQATQGAAVTVSRATLLDHQEAALLATEGATIDAELVLVERVRNSPRGTSGLRAYDTAGVHARKVVVRDVSGSGAGVSTSATATIADVVVLDPRAVGSGAFVNTGGALRMERVAIVRALSTGIFATGVDTMLYGRDVQVLEARSRSGAPDRTGTAIAIESGATFDLDRVRVDRAGAFGVFVYSDPEAEDVRTTGTMANVDVSSVGPRLDTDGSGLYFRGDVDVDVRRARIVDADQHAVLAFNYADVRIEDLEVDGGVTGIRTTDQAIVEVTRVKLTDARATALCVSGDSRVRARHVEVLEPSALLPGDNDALFCAFGVPFAGAGIVVNNIAMLDIDTYAVRRAPGIGFSIRGPRAAVARAGTIEQCITGMQIAPEVAYPDVLLDTSFAENTVDLDIQ